MKKVTAIVGACVLATSLCVSGYAGFAKGRIAARMEDRQEKRLDVLEKELNLTAEQKGKIAAIMKESGDRMLAEGRKARETRKAELQDADTRIKAVLTPEQQTKYDALKAKRKAEIEEKIERRRRR